MEALISAVLGDLAGRAISFVVDKCREQRTAEEDLQRLQQLLLRLRAIVEEAEGRRVTNRGMICQVSMITKQMFRGYYLLDTFKCREKKANDEEELLGDVDKAAWKRLLQSAERCMTRGSKIIVTSRSEKMVRFGTTEAIKLSCLSKEAYWYFFKMLVFGSTDPEEHPRLTSIAMELALRMCGSFICAYVIAALLRENLSAWFWCRVLRSFRKYMQKNLLLAGEYFYEDKPRYVMTIAETRRVSGDRKLFLLHHSYQKGPAAQGKVPRITLADVLFSRWGTVPWGKFEVLCWRSLIPPYYNYIYACEFVRHKNTTP
ncbi:unnamed protein product [Triticum turgidum subsp. durum]|uniref:Disease resistance N-terminal domain-containing protein n=1 Tax=Triticum turgidum subsp. durum TaxID=4567 RepID=A0A9R0R3M6_TRITD|nr:unnamed protein product [Triticum turgidum subsp. durum]